MRVRLNYINIKYLIDFIVYLIELSKDKVGSVFSDFINKNRLSSVQINFLETIEEFLT